MTAKWLFFYLINCTLKTKNRISHHHCRNNLHRSLTVSGSSTVWSSPHNFPSLRISYVDRFASSASNGVNMHLWGRKWPPRHTPWIEGAMVDPKTCRSPSSVTTPNLTTLGKRYSHTLRS